MQTPPRLGIVNHSVPVVVLVSSQHGGVGLVRSLGREGIRVYGVHENLLEPAAQSRYLRGGVFCWDFPCASAASSLSFLRDVARSVGTQAVLIPTSDLTALFVAENVAALAEHFLIASPPVECVRVFSSKKLTAELCKRMGIPTPETALPRSREQLLDFIYKTKFPVIVKGEYGDFLLRRKHRARVAIVKSKEELLDIYDLNASNAAPGLIFQEYIPGGDDAIWMFNGYFDERSECLFAATGRKLRQYPPHRGHTCLGVSSKNDTVETQTRQLMRAVAYRGPLDVGYRFDARDGCYKLLDVNPRIGATFRLFACENGLDVARALYLNVTGQPVPPSQVAEGRRWIVETNDMVSSWTSFREGQLSPAGWWRSVRAAHEGVWLDGDDARPLLTLPLVWCRHQFRGQVRSASHNSSPANSAAFKIR